MKVKIFLYFLILIVFIGIGSFLFRDKIIRLFFAPRQNDIKVGVNMENVKVETKDIEIVAQNLDIPWEIAFLPDGNMLVTQRGGKLLKIGTETKVITEIAGVRHIGEGGLLGLSLHPNFSSNNFIYLYSTTQDSSGITNRVERYRFVNDSLTDRKVIIEGIKGSSNHDGGRIAFGPDGYLYITTGDAETPSLAQDKNSLNGKILRFTDEGGIPPDNPFGNAVYSFGHRNPQGITWDKGGNLWATEHGPSGTQTGYDEVNIITKGGNYGWPEIRGDETREGLYAPVIQSGSRDTWAPSGMIYWDGSLFFAGLRGQALYEVKITSGNKLELITHFKNEFGRIRTVAIGKDVFFYILTNNRDGRGVPNENDDKIIKINPQIFR